MRSNATIVCSPETQSKEMSVGKQSPFVESSFTLTEWRQNSHACPLRGLKIIKLERESYKHGQLLNYS